MINQYFFMTPRLNDLFSDKSAYDIMTRVQVNDLCLTWILCVYHGFEQAQEFVNRLNSQWAAIGSIENLLQEEILYVF